MVEGAAVKLLLNFSTRGLSLPFFDRIVQFISEILKCSSVEKEF